MPWIMGVAAIGGALISSNAASDAADTQAAATEKGVGASQAQYNTTRKDLAPYRDAGEAALARLNSLIGVGPQPNVGGTTSYQLPTYDDILSYNQARGGDANDAATQYAQIQSGQMGSAEDIYNRYKASGYDLKSALTSTGGTPDPQYGSLLKNFAPSDLAADPIYKSALDFTTQQGERAINARRAAGGTYDSGAALKELGQFDLGNASALGSDAYNRFNTNRSLNAGLLQNIAGTGLSAAGATSQAGASNASNLANLYTGQGNAAAAAGIASGNAISGGINSAISNYNSTNLLNTLTTNNALSGGGLRSIAPNSAGTNPYIG